MMNREGELLFRPGTLVLLFFIAVFGFAVFNWAANNVIASVEKSGDEGTQAIDCSELDAKVIAISEANNRTKVSFVINKEVEEVYVLAVSPDGSNTTETVNYPETGEINSVNMGIEDVSSASVSTSLCESGLE